MSNERHLTAEETRHEIAQLRELLEQKIKALDAVISARLDAMDRALVLADRQSNLADLAQQYEDLVHRLTKLEKNSARTKYRSQSDSNSES
jgi:hypothetical protein